MAPLIPIAGSLIANLVPELFKLFGTEKQAEVATKVMDIAKSVTGINDPDEAAKAIAADPTIALQFKTAVLNQQTALEELAFRREKMYVDDVQDARKYRDDKVFWLGVIVLGSFMTIMGLTLWGLYALMTKQFQIDPALIAAVFGLVGSIIGYFAANAQQVVGYFFGSSSGSKQSGDAVRDSIKAMQNLKLK